MNLIMNKKTFDINNIYCVNKSKKTIIPNNQIQNIFYSNELFTNSTIILKIPVDDVFLIENFNKYRVVFNTNLNSDVIKYIQLIEEGILNLLGKNLTIEPTLTNEFNAGEIKLINTSNNSLYRNYSTFNLCIKITGIWFNKTTKGLNYKILYM